MPQLPRIGNSARFTTSAGPWALVGSPANDLAGSAPPNKIDDLIVTGSVERSKPPRSLATRQNPRFGCFRRQDIAEAFRVIFERPRNARFGDLLDIDEEIVTRAKRSPHVARLARCGCEFWRWLRIRIR